MEHSMKDISARQKRPEGSGKNPARQVAGPELTSREEELMKESELRKHTHCTLCGKALGELPVPIFWRVKLERFVLDVAAVTRQQGLTMQLGGHAPLAAVMGPDEDMANAVGDPVVITVCDPCAIQKNAPIMELAEEKT